MPEIRPSELLRQIHRLSVAISMLRLTPFQKRELEGALYALSWVLRHVETAPVDWMLPAPTRAHIDSLLTTVFLLGEGAPVVDQARPTFIDRSQPREHEPAQ